ncbi:MAG TPA: FliG C-terminal domain-containing protein [Spirochaetia bacterium]|nr:FliG C-terminal domain-containing protein [Spirochaetia bacterium]
MNETPENRSKDQSSQKIVEMVRQLLRLYGARSTKVAEYDLKLREKSLEQAKRIVADAVGSTLQADTYIDDPKFELRVLARAIARVSPSIRMKLVEALPGTVREDVRSRMFVFEDILYLDDRAMQKLLSRLDTATSALSLVQANPEIVRMVFRNLSRRAAQMFREELEYRENADAEEVQRARESAARILGQLCDEGEIEFMSAPRHAPHSAGKRRIEPL